MKYSQEHTAREGGDVFHRKQDITLSTLSYFNISEAFNSSDTSITPSSLYSVSPFCIPPMAGGFRGKVDDKKEVEQLLEAKRIQGPRQLINVLLVSQQLKSTFLAAHRYPARRL